MQNQGDQLPGQMIAGRYRVVEKIDQGGTGAIYLATQEPLGRRVALKVLLLAFANDPTAIKRFEKEARAIGKAAHPNIVTIFDFGQAEDGRLFIAMEYLDGISLRDLLHREGRLRHDRALHIIHGVVRGLAEAHRRGVLHRDLKPENVMLVEYGDDRDFVKVLDFGLAQQVSEIPGRAITHQNIIPGTPDYMAPERLNGPSDDLRSDLYSLGAMWFELLAGVAPFVGDTGVKTLMMHQEDPIPDLREKNIDPKTPDATLALITKLLAKTPAGRPSSASFLEQQLQEFATGAWAVESTKQQAIARKKTPADATFQDSSVEFSMPTGAAPALVSLADLNQPDSLADESAIVELIDRKDDSADGDENRVVLLTKIKSRPQQRAIAPKDLQATELAISQARNLDLIARAVVDHLQARFEKIAVIDLRNENLGVIDATNLPEPMAIARLIQATKPLARMLERGEAYYGPPPTTSPWQHVFLEQKRPLPDAILVAALQRADMPSFLIYGEQASAELDLDLSSVSTLMRKTAEKLTSIDF